MSTPFCAAGYPTWSAHAAHHGGHGLDRLRRRQPGHHHARLLTRHGRATPLVWLTVDTALSRTAATIMSTTCWSGLAEPCRRGSRCASWPTAASAIRKFYQMLTEELYFDYVIRFRGNITVTSATGETRTAAAWVGRRTRPRAARRRGHRRSLPGGNRGVCAGHGDEAGLVPGRQQHRCHCQASDQPLRQALGNRMQFARHQGSALRHGSGHDPCQHARAA